MNDTELQREVLEALVQDRSVRAAHIGVTAQHGVVTLTGHVPSYNEKHAAEQAAAHVRGVRAVANEVDVKLPGVARRTDEEIATACLGALTECYPVPHENIMTVVSEGWVTLSGVVECWYEKNAAERAIQGLAGVRGISNGINIEPKSATAP